MLFKNLILLTISQILLIGITSSTHAEELLSGFQSAKPPFIIPSSPYSKHDLNKAAEGLGIHIDIARAALKVKGHTIKHVFVKEQRLNKEFEQGRLDIAFDVRPTFNDRFYSTEKFSKYENAFITKRSKNYQVKEFNDLRTISFVAWQGASKDLGKKYNDVVKNNKGYIEKTNTSKIKIFLSGRVDGLLIDKNIFKWYYTEIAKGEEGLGIFNFHTLKELSPRGGLAGFKSASIRDDFDTGMKTIIKNGTYEKIVDSYFK